MPERGFGCGGAAGSMCLAIAFVANSAARAALCFAVDKMRGCSELLGKPISTSRRMASERVVSFDAAQTSTASTTDSGKRDETSVPRPVAGRPRPLFDLFMNKSLP